MSRHFFPVRNHFRCCNTACANVNLHCCHIEGYISYIRAARPFETLTAQSVVVVGIADSVAYDTGLSAVTVGTHTVCRVRVRVDSMPRSCVGCQVHPRKLKTTIALGLENKNLSKKPWLWPCTSPTSRRDHRIKERPSRLDGHDSVPTSRPAPREERHIKFTSLALELPTLAVTAVWLVHSRKHSSSFTASRMRGTRGDFLG